MKNNIGIPLKLNLLDMRIVLYYLLRRLKSSLEIAVKISFFSVFTFLFKRAVEKYVEETFLLGLVGLSFDEIESKLFHSLDCFFINHDVMKRVNDGFREGVLDIFFDDSVT